MDTMRCPECGGSIGEDEVTCPFCDADIHGGDEDEGDDSSDDPDELLVMAAFHERGGVEFKERSMPVHARRAEKRAWGLLNRALALEMKSSNV